MRELTGLDVSSTDGREKLSLGLKAMRVLGIAAPRGPATEPGAEGGRVPRSRRLGRGARSTALATSSPATSSGSVLRWARASTNAPSSAQIIAIVSSRARARSSPAPAYSCRAGGDPALEHVRARLPQVSLLLETSSATVAIGQASS